MKVTVADLCMSIMELRVAGELDKLWKASFQAELPVARMSRPGTPRFPLTGVGFCV